MKKTSEEMINVLLVSSKYPPEYAGSGLRAHRTYQRLMAKYPVRYSVLSSSLTENSIGSYEYEGVPVQRISRKIIPLGSATPSQRTLKHKLGLRLNYFSEFLPAWRYLRSHHHDYDLFHVFGNVAVTSAAVTFCNKVRKPLIVEFCNEDTTPYPYKPALIKLFFPRAFHPETHFICISKRLEHMCRRQGLTENIWTRPNPVDTQVFQPVPQRKQELRRKYTPFTKDDIVLVSVASFTPNKNLSFLVDVLACLPEKFKLVLAGPTIDHGPDLKRDQSYIQEIKTKIEAHHLNQRVHLIPRFIERVDEFMKMADVFLFPSIDEGLGTPMLESLCCGVPVVANRIEGVTDVWIKDGQNGYLSGLEADSFAKKIILSLQLPQEVFRQSVEELRTVIDVSVIDERYWDLLRKLCVQKPCTAKGAS